MKISNRTFVVSGGASGLGLATVKDLLSQGAYVSVLDLNEENGQRVVKELGNKAKFSQCDVTDSGSIKAAIDGTIEWIKSTGADLGGCVAAAGVGFPGKVPCHLLF